MVGFELGVVIVFGTIFAIGFLTFGLFAGSESVIDALILSGAKKKLKLFMVHVIGHG